jgi:1,4-dihydroxy-2-naphthoate octaprenyltransferase
MAERDPLSRAFDRWLYALKPGSWPKLLLPMLLGQCLGVAARGAFDPRALLVGGVFTLFGLAFIVLLNDWGDRRVDALKRRLFPEGCSPKTIPDGILPAPRVLAAGLAAGAVAMTAAWGGAAWLGVPWLGAMGVVDMLLFLSYTLPPLRLNYRGGGELLEMIGVGVALPWFNAYAQSGQLWLNELWVLPGFALLALASAVASGLSDEVSDREGGKTTLTTRLGNAAARAVVEVLVPLSLLAWLSGALLGPAAPPAWALSPVLALVGWNYLALRRESPAAVTNAFAAQARYKRSLHRAIWHGAALLSAVVALHGLVS